MTVCFFAHGQHELRRTDETVQKNDTDAAVTRLLYRISRASRCSLIDKDTRNALRSFVGKKDYGSAVQVLDALEAAAFAQEGVFQ